MWFWLFVAVAVSGGCTYQICFKLAPTNTNTFLFLTGMYAVAGALAFSGYLLTRATGTTISGMSGPSGWGWLCLGCGVGTFLIELGYVFALGTHKVDLSSFTPAVLGIVIMLVTIVGAWKFREDMTTSRIAGAVLVIAGIALLKWK